MDMINNQKRILALFVLVFFLFVGKDSLSRTFQGNSGQSNVEYTPSSQEKKDIDEIEKMLLKRMKEDKGKMDLAKKAVFQNDQARSGVSGKNTQSFSTQSVSLPTMAEYNAPAGCRENMVWTRCSPRPLSGVSTPFYLLEFAIRFWY